LSALRWLRLLAAAGGSLLASQVSPADTRIAAVSKSSVPAISKDARDLPINVDSSHIDRKGDKVDFTDIVITQGDTKVQADHAHATGIEQFENSHWTFDGNVRIDGEQQGRLRSDQAVIEFRNKAIAKATATGSPAEFEQRRADTNEIARGRAHEIVYDVTDGTVRLSNDAWLCDGHNQISGAELTYNIREQRVQADSDPGSDKRVHLVIGAKPTESPKVSDDCANKP
jgi:lipopolysaccharide transport protein LptA